MITHQSDSDLKKDILDELKWNSQIRETDIGVIVKDGAVTLTGTVPSYAQKTAASKAAKLIKGVRAVADEIEVKLPSQMQGTDKDIAEEISRSFEWSTQIPADDIKAEVRSGFVTLTGNVDWQYQRDSAQKQVETLKGVRMVLNNINIRKRASVPNIKSEIAKALHRHASIEANNVNIAALDGTVTLSGNVDNYFERGLIENAVWSAPGVTKVVDKLTVTSDFD